MKIYFATDHAGFEMKEELIIFVRDELGYEVEDFGAFELNQDDDYPDFIHQAAAAVSKSGGSDMAIILGGSGQGEAMVANKHKGVRAVVYYGEPAHPQQDAGGAMLDIIESARMHNNANVLSLGARFIDLTTAKNAVSKFLKTPFSNEPRHVRRINKIEL